METAKIWREEGLESEISVLYFSKDGEEVDFGFAQRSKPLQSPKTKAASASA